MLAIIGNAGLFEHLPGEIVRRETSRTAFGEPSSLLFFAEVAGHTVLLIERHGRDRRIPPHAVNDQANLLALYHHGVKRILSVCSMYSLTPLTHPEISPGDLCLPDQLIDYTWGRASTFFESADAHVVDFAEPYDAALRASAIQAASQAGVKLLAEGVYAITQGPRLPTRGEVKRLGQDGAHLVGMSGMPEAILARELELAYATLGVVTGYAAGCGNDGSAGKGRGDDAKPSRQTVPGELRNMQEAVWKLIEGLASA